MIPLLDAEKWLTKKPFNKGIHADHKNLAVFVPGNTQHYYFAIRTADEAFNWSEITRILEVPKLSCSDINGDGIFKADDLDYLLSYLYNNGPAPVQAAGDVNGSGTTDVADAMFMINYWLNFGPPPACH